MTSALRLKLPGGAIALAGAGVLAVGAILGIAGIVMGTQCLLQSTEPGQCGVTIDPVITTSIAPAAIAGETPPENTSTVVMQAQPAAAPKATGPADAATASADQLIDDTFRLLPTEAGLPLAMDKPVAEPAATVQEASAEAEPLSTGVTPLDFSKPAPASAKASVPMTARSTAPVRIAYAADSPAEDTPPPDGSAAAAVTSLARSDVVKVGSSSLNVRAGPSLSEEKLFVLEPDKEIEVVEQSKGWARIVDPEGREGWVDTTYLANPDRPAAKAPPEQTADTAPQAVEPATPRERTAAVAPQAEKAATPAAAGSNRRIVGGSGVNVRGGPSKASSKLFTLAAGQAVTVTGSNKGWLSIVDAEGRAGWIYQTYLTVPN